MNNLYFLLVFILFGSCSSDKHTYPDPYQIEVTGNNFEWHILYPGVDGQLYTVDDIEDRQNLNLPYNIPVEIILKSEDYLYFLEFPQFNQVGVAVADQTHYMRFKPNRTGTYDLKGNQMCANTHKNLLGKLYVYRPFWFSFWQNRNLIN